MNNRGNFLIYTPQYNENTGGIIALHKLCHVLNELGETAYLYPALATKKPPLGRRIKQLFKPRPFLVNPFLSTPIATPTELSPESIVIYPETVNGNPLNAKHVVRWLLHNPGFHTGQIEYGQNEFHIRYQKGFSEFHSPGNYFCPETLMVSHYPLEHYNSDGALSPQERSGTAHCLRKGAGKKMVHEMKNSTLIDGKSHAEIASIFKRVKLFVSYDTQTAYSRLAVLCGCDSIVIPDDKIPKHTWQPDIKLRHGVAYGFEDIDEAKKTRHLVLPCLLEEQEAAKTKVQQFVVDTRAFFSKL